MGRAYKEGVGQYFEGVGSQKENRKIKDGVVY